MACGSCLRVYRHVHIRGSMRVNVPTLMRGSNGREKRRMRVCDRMTLESAIEVPCWRNATDPNEDGHGRRPVNPSTLSALSQRDFCHRAATATFMTSVVMLCLSVHRRHAPIKHRAYSLRNTAPLVAEDESSRRVLYNRMCNIDKLKATNIHEKGLLLGTHPLFRDGSSTLSVSNN